MSLPPPAPSVLAALHDDHWALVVGHAKRVVRELDGAARADLGDLVGLSTAQLLRGHGRERLELELSTGGALWSGVADRLVAEDESGWRQRLSPDDEPSGQPAADVEVAVEEATRSLRERVRELVDERDRERRRADGAEARARSASTKLDDTTEALTQVQARVAELERELAAAADEREAALDRQRRQHQTDLATLREEVRSLRRAEEERRSQRRRREEAEQATRRAEREAEQAARRAAKTGRRGAHPGRPSRLPPGVQPGTTAAARSLLSPSHLVLVDGYNLTMRHRGHLDLEQQRAALVAILEAAAVRTRSDIEVLFDSRHGSPRGGMRSRAIRVRFTAPGVTADDEIVFEVSAQPEDQPILVVTDDRELRDRVRPYAVDLLATGEFLRAVE